MNLLNKVISNRVARNAGWIVVCRVIQVVFSLILSMLTTRCLGPEKYGLVSYAASVMLFASPIAQLGYTSTLVHEIISDPQDEGKILGSAIISSLVSSLLCIAGVSLFVQATSPDDPMTLRVCQLYSLLLISQGIELIQYWFQSKLLSKYTALTTLIVYLLMFVYQVFILLTDGSIYLFSMSKALQHGIIALVLLVLYRRQNGQKLVFSLRRMVSLLKNSRSYILSLLLIMVYLQTDRIMIKAMLGAEAMGFYSAAVLCATCTEFLFVAIIDSFRPVVLSAKLHNHQEFEDKMCGLYAVMIGLSLIQSLLITLLARPLIVILCGNAYLPAAGTLRIVTWYTVFSYIGMARSIWIIAQNRNNLLLAVNASGSLMNVVMNLAFIPALGIEGAALASLISQFFVNVGTGFLFKPLRENNRLLFRAFRPAAVLELIKKL